MIRIIITLALTLFSNLMAMETFGRRLLEQGQHTPYRGDISFNGYASTSLAEGLVFLKEEFVPGKFEGEAYSNDMKLLGIIALEVEPRPATPQPRVISPDAKSVSAEDLSIRGPSDEITFKKMMKSYEDEHAAVSWSIAVYWQEGWVDTNTSRLDANYIMRELRKEAFLYSRQILRPINMKLLIDGWEQEPQLANNILSWAFATRVTTCLADESTGPTVSQELMSTTCLLGGGGNLRLVGTAPLEGRQALNQALNNLTTSITWSPGYARTAKPKEGTSSRNGGLRELIIPVAESVGNPDSSHRTTNGVSFDWLWWALALGVLITFWLKHRYPIKKTVIALKSSSRCSACGALISHGSHRCTLCGTNLVVR